MKKIILALSIVNCLAIIIAVIILSIPQKQLPSIEPVDNINNTIEEKSTTKTYKIFAAFDDFPFKNDTKYVIWINVPEFRLRFYQQGKLIDSGMIAGGKHFSPTIDVLANEITYRPFFSPTENELKKGWKAACPDNTFPPAKPRNPLGRRRIVLHQSFRLHGTNNENSLGKAASNGCTRVENLVIERITDSIVSNSRIIKHFGKKNTTETFIIAEPFRIIQCYRLWNNLFLVDSILYLTVFPDVHRRLDKELFEPSFPWSKDILGNAYLKEHFINDLLELGLFTDINNPECNKCLNVLWENVKDKIRNTKNNCNNTYIVIKEDFRKLIYLR